ncbi:MAG: hypothetical protein J6Y78_02385 [Paludibacteraceae bacterium]|nr:hypothetical protein [Paludibacteraceae bacterium]
MKGLKVYSVQEDGSLENYDKKNTITIKRKKYSISNNPNLFYRIEDVEKVRTSGYLKAILKDKYVFRIRKADANNEEICVKLSFFQSLIFQLPYFPNKVKRFILSVLETILKLFNCWK